MIKAWEFNPHIAHLTKEEAAAFDEKDPNTRRDKIASLLGKYGLLTPAAVNTLYGGGEVGNPAVFNLQDVSAPVTTTAKDVKGEGTSRTRWVSPSAAAASKKPGKPGAAAEPPPSLIIPTGPVTIEVGNKPIILGSLGANTVHVSWDGDPHAENLTLSMTTTEAVG